MSKNEEGRKSNMIKTLRITSIAAAILAVVFFVFLGVSGFRSDEQLEQFLSSPGVVERIKETKAERAKRGESRVSPLVKQAEAFALYLNPPAPVKKKRPSTPKRSVTPRPQAVSPKFKVVATSYYALRPEQSLVLIDEPGKGLRWVKQSGSVGHLVLEQVKDGAVVVRDGQRTFELVPSRLPTKELVESPSSGKKRSKSISKPILPIPAKSRPRVVSSKSQEEIEAEREKMMGELKAMKADVESDETHSGDDAEKTITLLEEFISDLEAKAMRVSSEEAEELDRLGRELDVGDIQQDANRISRADRRPRRHTDDSMDANVQEANISEVNVSEVNVSEVNSLQEE
jgi:hypothetical protein